MKWIEKKISPEAKKALDEFIKKGGENAKYTNFKNSDGKDKVRESLLEEQGFLCAYCMKRINLDVKIEHWISQASSIADKQPHQTLDYGNLLAVCNGTDSANDKINEHCDRTRKDIPLTIKPTNQLAVSKLKYLTNGAIKTDDLELKKDIEESLQLNCLYLMDQRKNALSDAKTIYKLRSKNLKQDQEKKILERLQRMYQVKHTDPDDQKDKYKEFCEFVLYFYSK